MRLNILSLFLVVGFLLLAYSSVSACSCAGSGAPCQAFWNASAVFSGTIDKVDVINPETVLPDGRKVYGPRRREVYISVIEGFSGIGEEKSVKVHTGGGGGDCGYDFQQGQQYLIYAYKNPQTGQLSTGICTRTRLLEKAAQDVEYFHSLKTAKPGARIYGYIFQSYPRRNDAPYVKPSPLVGILVKIEGEGGKFATQTDAKGEYEFTGVPAGEYKIGIEAPKNLWGYEQGASVKAFDKGCAGYAFYLQTNTALSGKLFDEKSIPAEKVSVELMPVDQVNNSRHPDYKFDYTNETGSFLIRSIPAGKYYLGVRLNGMSELDFPYPQTFYPGTLNLNEAKIISIEEGQILENFDFKLPQKLQMRKISGTVLYPDGTPAANAHLAVNETEYFYSFLFRGVSDTKPDGTFSFEIVDGIRYLVKPHVSINGSQRHAEPIELPANGNVTNLKFVITEPNGNCEKCLRWKRSGGN